MPEKLQLWKGRSSDSISLLFGVVGTGFTFMSPDNNKINLKYEPYLFNCTFDRAPWVGRFHNYDIIF